MLYVRVRNAAVNVHRDGGCSFVDSVATAGKGAEQAHDFGDDTVRIFLSVVQLVCARLFAAMAASKAHAAHPRTQKNTSVIRLQSWAFLLAKKTSLIFKLNKDLLQLCEQGNQISCNFAMGNADH